MICRSNVRFGFELLQQLTRFSCHLCWNITKVRPSLRETCSAPGLKYSVLNPGLCLNYSTHDFIILSSLFWGFYRGPLITWESEVLPVQIENVHSISKKESLKCHEIKVHYPEILSSDVFFMSTTPSLCGRSTRTLIFMYFSLKAAIYQLSESTLTSGFAENRVSLNCW